MRTKFGERPLVKKFLKDYVKDLQKLQKALKLITSIENLRMNHLQSNQTISFFHHPKSKKILEKVLSNIENILNDINLPIIRNHFENKFKNIKEQIKSFYNSYTYDNFNQLIKQLNDYNDEIAKFQFNIFLIESKERKEKLKLSKEYPNINPEVYNARRAEIINEAAAKKSEISTRIDILEMWKLQIKEKMDEMEQSIRAGEINITYLLLNIEKSIRDLLSPESEL